MDAKTTIAIELVRQGQGAQQAISDLRSLESQTQRTAQAGEHLAAGWNKFYGLLAAAAGGALVRGAIHEFEQAERAAKALDGALIAAGQHSAEYSDELKKMAEALGRVSGTQAEAVQQVQAILVQFGALRSEMPRLTQNILDMAAAGYDLQTVARSLGAAVSGEFEPIRRLLKIDFAEGATRAEKLEQVLSTMEGRFSGLAASQGATTSGIKEMNLAIKDALQALGELISNGITPYTRLIGQAASNTAEFIRWLSKLGGKGVDQQAEFDLIDSLLKQRTELTRLILAQVESKQITEQQGQALRDYIRTMTTAEDMYKRLAAVRAFLRGEGDLPVEAHVPIERTLDPEAAARAMQEASARMKLYQSLNFAPRFLAARGTGFNPSPLSDFDFMMGARAQMEATLREQLDLGRITIEQYSAQRAELMNQYRQAMAQIAKLGAEASDQSFIELQSALTRDLLAIQAEYDKRRDLIRAYYEFEQDQLEHNSFAWQLVEQNKTAALEQNEEARRRAIEQTTRAHDEQLQLLQDIARFASYQFAAGFSRAFVDFISGVKDAKAAFQEFAASFLSNVAQMIMQLMILRLIKSAFGGALGLADGGVVMAANGTLAGVQSVSTPTYFPKFNVLAGEAGREMLAVFARPTTANIGGIPAIIGDVGPSRLVMLDASALARLSPRRAAAGTITGDVSTAGAAPAAGGQTTILIMLEKGLRAQIVDEAIQGAQIRILNDLNEDTPISNSVKQIAS